MDLHFTTVNGCRGIPFFFGSSVKRAFKSGALTIAVLLAGCSRSGVTPETSGITHMEQVTSAARIGRVDDFAVLDAGDNQGSQKIQLRKSRTTALAMLDPNNIPTTLEQGHNAKFRRTILIWPNDHEHMGETTLLVSSAVLKKYKLSVTPGLITPVGISFSDKEIHSAQDMRTAHEVGIMDIAFQILPKLKIIAVDEHMKVLATADLSKAKNPGEATQLLHDKINSVSISGFPKPPSPDAARSATTS